MAFDPLNAPEDFSIEELQKRLKLIKEQGFVPIFGKKRNAAIGESLEKYLGLETNSSRKADWGEYELKTSTRGLNSKISLFNVKWNFEKNYNFKKLTYEYGKPHHSKHLDLPVIRLDWDIKHSKIPIDELFINIPLIDGPLTLNCGENIIAVQNREKIEKWFNEKFKKLVLIKVKSKKVDNNYGFIIENATLLENTSFQNFIKLIHVNEIKLSFKLMIIQPNTQYEKLNRRGTGFRATQRTLIKLYQSHKSIL